MSNPLIGIRALLIFVLLEAVVCAVVYAQETPLEPDFYLTLNECKTTVGFLVPSQKGLAQTEPKPIHFVCFRKSQYVDCELGFSDSNSGVKGSTTQFAVKLDIPPILYLANTNFGDFVAINVVTHSVVVITRMLEDEYAGSKVCHGIFSTAYEMDKLLGIQK